MNGYASVLIGAFLENTLRSKLIDAVHVFQGNILWAPDGLHLLQLHADPTLALLVLDPLTTPQVPLTSIVPLLQRQDRCSLLVYTTFAPASIHAVAWLGRHGLRDVVFAPYEDSRERFARTLQRVIAQSHGEETIRE